MEDKTIDQLASEINISVKKILEISHKLGVEINKKCFISYDLEKKILKFFKKRKKTLKNDDSSKNKKNNIIDVQKKNNSLSLKFKNINLNIQKIKSLKTNKKSKLLSDVSSSNLIKKKFKNLNKNKDFIVNKKNREFKKNNNLVSISKTSSFKKNIKKSIFFDKNKTNFSLNTDKSKKISKETVVKKNNLNHFPINFFRKKIGKTVFSENTDRLLNIQKRYRNKNFMNSEFFLNKKNNFKNIKNNKKLSVKNYPFFNQVFKKPLKKINRDIHIYGDISISKLAEKMAIKSKEVIKNLLKIGISANINQVLDKDTAQLVSEEMGHKVLINKETDIEKSLLSGRYLNKKSIFKRPPIVTVMGHVDHGKTSLLDYIRSTKVVLKESGGITQSIGAYCVFFKKQLITFLDTPGHSAFTSMRLRGSKLTDIVILVVAADDGVMPQTIEAIKHAQLANVPIIVAINKIDKNSNNLEKIKKDLINYSVIPEEFGGENIFVSVSAKTGFGINELLNSILLQSEMLELKSIYKGMASGTVIESFIDKGRGPVANILVTEGTLKIGDIFVCGKQYGKVKDLRNEFHNKIKSAGPSIPVEVLGLSELTQTGDILIVLSDEKKARELSNYRKNRLREIIFSKEKKISVDNLFKKINKNVLLELNLVIKCDTQGSLEVIIDSIKNISISSAVKINILSSSVGAITETDVSLSITLNSIIIGFNVRPDSTAKKIILTEKLDVRYYSIIYRLLDDIKTIALGLKKPIYKQKIMGLAEVRNVFKLPKSGSIAGCMIIEGMIKKTNPIRILRKNIVIYEGELDSLRRFKKDVIEVRSGIECGIGIKNYHDIKIGDIIEVFKMILS